MQAKYPPPKISDYGLIGDGRTAALVSRYGSIDWGCFPRFDSPSQFAALLDPHQGGFFSIHPVGHCSSTQSYLEDTNVLETRFTSASGKARLLDAFTVTSEERKRNRLWPDHEILRVVEGLEGEVVFRMTHAPRPHYANPRAPVQFGLRKAFGFASRSGNDMMLLQASPEAGPIHADGDTAWAEFKVRAGQRVLFSLIYTEDAPAVIPPLGEAALARLDETLAYWKTWIAPCRYQGAYRASVRRSALALRLLIFAPSGAVVAAPTTSLPEVLGGGRNWDYRFCWLRDASFTVRALVDLGFQDEAHAFVSWMLHSTRLTRPKVQVLYDVYGESRMKEEELPWFNGYADSKPVRIGNAATQQHQLDVYGEVLDGVFHFTPFLDRIDGETRDFLLDIGRAIDELADQPDDGIWEVRSGRAHHTHSKAFACVGLQRLMQMCDRYGWKAPVARWTSAAGQLRTAIETHGYSAALGSYTRTFGGSDLDAALLVLPLIGYNDAGEARMRTTCDAVVRHLSEGRLLYRYRVETDGLPGKEGCFGICAFWLIENFARRGQVAEANDWMKSFLARRNAVELWSEEIDPVTGEFLGNYPQAFTHIGLINAAVSLANAERQIGVIA